MKSLIFRLIIGSMLFACTLLFLFTTKQIRRIESIIESNKANPPKAFHKLTASEDTLYLIRISPMTIRFTEKSEAKNFFLKEKSSWSIGLDSNIKKLNKLKLLGENSGLWMSIIAILIAVLWLYLLGNELIIKGLFTGTLIFILITSLFYYIELF